MLKLLVGAYISLAVPAYLLYRKRKSDREAIWRFLEEQDDAEAKYVFVGHANRTCGAHVYNMKECGGGCSYRHIRNVLAIINSATESLAVCMYHLTLEQVLVALLNAYERGVRIRCITDEEMVRIKGSKIYRLIKQGITVKVPNYKKTNVLMHHKYIIIDENSAEKRRVLWGSANFTIQAFLNNWEHVMCTNNEIVVAGFRDEFDKLWDEFVPVQLPTVK